MQAVEMPTHLPAVMTPVVGGTTPVAEMLTRLPVVMKEAVTLVETPVVATPTRLGVEEAMTQEVVTPVEAGMLVVETLVPPQVGTPLELRKILLLGNPLPTMP